VEIQITAFLWAGLCFTKWRQTPGIGTQVPQRSREGKTERTGRAQPR
jgi:hypothetical protein